MSKATTNIITIDGPAASGKSSVSRELAYRLGWSWVSTGSFYRGLGYVALESQVDLEDEKALVQLCNSDTWKVVLSPEQTLVFFNDKDVTAQIYQEEVGLVASKVSQYPLVRKSLLKAQQDCAVGVKGLVAEGRDCGTIVFPKAKLKFYITASSQHRAERRAKEQGRDIEATQSAQYIRDKQDTQRTVAPLQVPAGSHVVDTSDMDLQQVIEKVFETVQKELKS